MYIYIYIHTHIICNELLNNEILFVHKKVNFDIFYNMDGL